MSQPAPRQAALAHLAALAGRPGGRRITPLFDADPERARKFSASLDDLTLDFSKSAIDRDALDALFALADAVDLEGFRRRLFAGEMVNATEHRAAMHMALRSPREAGLKAALASGIDDASKLAVAERNRMRGFVTAIHEGSQRGASGERLTHVVNIGIGGSDLGPRVATEGLTIGRTDARMEARFLSNVDGHGFEAALAGLDPARTLFLVASKTFTTLETQTNAHAARAWLVAKLGESAVGRHFAALSTNLKAVGEFGIAPERTFGFRDWVGGRYSLWSAIGLPIALAIGSDGFRRMLAGAHAMDEHFRTAPLERNLPVRIGLLDVWYRNFHRFTSRSIAPYHSALKRVPAYLQQLEMESNGKQVDAGGQPLPFGTSPVLWGEPGTNGQHAYFQMLHQGTDATPLEFVAVRDASHDLEGHHNKLLANALAQAQALMQGKADAGGHKNFPGNRPSTFFVFEKLTPEALGAFLAMYEHRVFTSGALWGINSFDQWGVELGKVLAKDIEPRLTSGDATGLDASTAGLMARLRPL